MAAVISTTVPPLMAITMVALLVVSLSIGLWCEDAEEEVEE
jgi:hypothetical protein